MKTPKAKLVELDATLRHCIRGQPDGLLALQEPIWRRELHTVPPGGPRGCLILAGPTGVGKTESATTVAEVLFQPGAFLRVDCSEYKTLDSLVSLLGDPTGHRGRLGRGYDCHPEGVWLWDEIEKAHPELVHLFLQMADTGRLTLACGETLDLSGIYLILSTNLGSAEIIGREHLTFTSLERHVVRCLEEHLSPELLGRFTRHSPPIVFCPLGPEVQAEITELRLNDLLEWQRQRGRQIKVGSEVLPFLIYRGFSRRLGARPLIGFIEAQVGNAIVRRLMADGQANGTLVVQNDQLVLLP